MEMRPYEDARSKHRVCSTNTGFPPSTSSATWMGMLQRLLGGIRTLEPEAAGLPYSPQLP